MGLLRKAAAGNRGDTQAVSPSVHRTSGLLRRSFEALDAEESHAGPEPAAGVELPVALSVELAPPPEGEAILPLMAEEQAKAIATPQQVISEIVSAILGLPEGVELPSQLFSTLASRLGIEKGALLLYDPLRLVYAPWASHGYDQTTLHRMRIPLGANESFNALANGAPISLSDPPLLAAYQQYFSAREFAFLSRILLTPFIAEEKLVGVLLLTEIKPPFEGDQELLQCLERIAETGSPLVQKARGEKLARAGPQGIRAPASPAEETSRFLSAAGSTRAKVLFISLSLEEYARDIIAAHEHLDPFRLHEDMHYFLGAFVADLGTTIPVRQGLYIVGLQDLDTEDLDLFMHQLKSFLGGLFGGNGRTVTTMGPRILKTRSWPADGSDIQELVDFLSF